MTKILKIIKLKRNTYNNDIVYIDNKKIKCFFMLKCNFLNYKYCTFVPQSLSTTI